MWYPRHMLHTRFGLFWGGATLAGAFSGLLAFAISFMSGTAGLLGWSWIFVRVSDLRIELEAAMVTGLIDHRGDVHSCSRRGRILRSVD